MPGSDWLSCLRWKVPQHQMQPAKKARLRPVNELFDAFHDEKAQKRSATRVSPPSTNWSHFDSFKHGRLRQTATS